MKYKIQILAAGKTPNDDMCKAIAVMFPPFVDDDNVHLTRADEPGSYLSQSEFADYTIEGEASTIASEVRSTAVAAFRYRNKHYKKRDRMVDDDDDVAMGGMGAEEAVEEGAVRVNVPSEDENDAALIGLDSESEGELDESEVEGVDEGDDED
jgi:hypothetical protein